MSIKVNTDFERLIHAQMGEFRSDLQKDTSLISALLGPKGVRKGGVEHDSFVGKVDFEDSDESEVFPDTPQGQFPSYRKRADRTLKAKILVPVPREVAQTTGQGLAKLTSDLLAQCRAAMVRKIEDQIGRLLQMPYRVNPIMDDRDTNPSTAYLPLAANYAPVGALGAVDAGINQVQADASAFHFANFIRAKVRMATAMGKGVTEGGSVGAGVKSFEAMDYIFWGENAVWQKILLDNFKFLSNNDFSSQMAAVEKDVLKMQTVQNIGIYTTSQPIRRELSVGENQTFGGFAADGSAVAAGGALAAPANPIEDTWKPGLFLPRSNFVMKKLDVDNMQLTVKEIQNKSFNLAIYGECNVSGRRFFDELVHRYWVAAQEIITSGA